MIDKYHYNLLKLSVLLVVVHDGVEAMGNSDNSALTELTPDGFLNEVISFQVHSSCGFIQH